MQHVHDLIIVGAGPAGASCARRAAELGLDVLVLERASFPRNKPCAAGLTERALALLGGDEDPVVHRRLYTSEIALGRGLTASFSGPDPLVVTTRRGEFDLLLAHKAERAGARVLFEHAAGAIERRAGMSVVKCGPEEYRARSVVFADGARGRGRALLGLPPLRLGGAAYVRAYPDGPDTMSAFAERVLFDLAAGPRGYGWVFPKNEHLNAGVFSQLPLSSRLVADLGRFLTSLNLPGWRAEGPFAFPIPIRTGREVLGIDGVLLAGDAAALADPISGEGISTAIASGRAAAESVAEMAGSSERLVSVYGRRIRDEVAPMAETMRRSGRIVYALGPSVLRTAGSFPLLRSAVSRLFRSVGSVRDGSLSVAVRYGVTADSRGGETP